MLSSVVKGCPRDWKNVGDSIKDTSKSSQEIGDMWFSLAYGIQKFCLEQTEEVINYALKAYIIAKVPISSKCNFLKTSSGYSVLIKSPLKCLMICWRLLKDILLRDIITWRAPFIMPCKFS